MVAFTAKIIEPVGLHARPAAVAVTEASKFQSDITVHCNGKSADLKSIIQVMKLGVQFSAQIEITCDGPDEQTAADTLQTILREKRIIQIQTGLFTGERRLCDWNRKCMEISVCSW